MVKSRLIMAGMAFLVCISGCREAGARKDHTGSAKAKAVSIQRTGIKDSVNQVDKAKYIQQVEKYVDSVSDRLSTLAKVKHDVFGASSEGGEINVYHRGSDTLKLMAIYYGESGKNEYQLYLKHSQPVFFIRKTISYKSPIGSGPVSTDKEKLATFILMSGKVISGKEGTEVVPGEIAAGTSAEIRAIHDDIRMQLRD